MFPRALLIVLASSLVASNLPEDQRVSLEIASPLKVSDLLGRWKVQGSFSCNGQNPVAEDTYSYWEFIQEANTQPKLWMCIEDSTGHGLGCFYGFTCDVTRNPLEMDLVYSDRRNHISHTQLGIFALENGVLRVCLAKYDDPTRPRSFRPRKGSDHRLYILERETKPTTSDEN